jgi:hypothetical protein
MLAFNSLRTFLSKREANRDFQDKRLWTTPSHVRVKDLQIVFKEEFWEPNMILTCHHCAAINFISYVFIYLFFSICALIRGNVLHTSLHFISYSGSFNPKEHTREEQSKEKSKGILFYFILFYLFIYLFLFIYFYLFIYLFIFFIFI